MNENEGNEYYWPAYVDFMTVLFFIALGIGGYMYYEYGHEIAGLKKYQQLVDEAIAVTKTLKSDFLKKNIQIDTSSKDKIKLKGDFLFDSDSDKLRDEQAVEQIREIGVSIKTMLDSNNNKTKYAILIEGHTDNVGDEEYNNILSYKRSVSISRLWKVKCQLILPDYEVVPAGFGELNPVISNTNEMNRRLNRRIEISIIPKLSQFTRLIQEK